jgi:hypothetical protein
VMRKRFPTGVQRLGLGRLRVKSGAVGVTNLLRTASGSARFVPPYRMVGTFLMHFDRLGKRFLVRVFGIA